MMAAIYNYENGYEITAGLQGSAFCEDLVS